MFAVEPISREEAIHLPIRQLKERLFGNPCLVRCSFLLYCLCTHVSFCPLLLLEKFSLLHGISPPAFGGCRGACSRSLLSLSRLSCGGIIHKGNSCTLVWFAALHNYMDG